VERPIGIRIIDAYERGDIAGPQTAESIGTCLGLEDGGKRLGRPLFLLGFEKRYESNGNVLHYPPRNGRQRRYQWPETQSLTRRMLDRGDSLALAKKALSIFGVEVVKAALDGATKDNCESSYALASRKNQEVNALKVKTAEEVITTEELAEALRESPNAPKSMLLNRVRGLVKAATRKGNWDDFRKSANTQGAV